MLAVIAVTITIVLGLAFLVATCACVALLLVRLLPGKPTPEDVLRERFARGEIDGQQFEEMRRRLGYTDHAPRRAA